MGVVIVFAIGLPAFAGGCDPGRYRSVAGKVPHQTLFTFLDTMIVAEREVKYKEDGVMYVGTPIAADPQSKTFTTRYGTYPLSSLRVSREEMASAEKLASALKVGNSNTSQPVNEVSSNPKPPTPQRVNIFMEATIGTHQISLSTSHPNFVAIQQLASDGRLRYFNGGGQASSGPHYWLSTSKGQLKLGDLDDVSRWISELGSRGP